MAKPPSSLDGIRAKLARACEQIDALDQQIQRLVADGQYRVVGQAHHDIRQYSFTAFGPSMSPRFSVLTGEAVHHLRSCLDHLVWQLVLATGQQPSERTEFPICDTPARFAEACKRGKLKGISANAERQVEALQPYHCPKLHDNWLWVVHELDRIDKHRLLVVVLASIVISDKIAIGSNTGNLEISGMSPPTQVVPTEAGVEVFRVYFGKDYQTDVRVEPQFELTAAIEQIGPVVKAPLVPVLRASLDCIRQITQSFDLEFQ